MSSVTGHKECLGIKQVKKSVPGFFSNSNGGGQMKIDSTIEKRVTGLLEEHPPCRDNIKKLIWSYWIKYDNLFYPDSSTIGEIENWFMYLATPPETLRRSWQKVQQHNEHLQGTKRRDRMARASKIRKEIVTHIPIARQENLL